MDLDPACSKWTKRLHTCLKKKVKPMYVSDMLRCVLLHVYGELYLDVSTFLLSNVNDSYEHAKSQRQRKTELAKKEDVLNLSPVARHIFRVGETSAGRDPLHCQDHREQLACGSDCVWQRSRQATVMEPRER